MSHYRPFRQNRSYSVAIVIILLALLLSYSSLNNLFGMRSVFISAIYPFQWVASVLWKGTVGIPSSIIDLRNLAHENSELKAKLDLLQTKLSLFDELAGENGRLREALGFQGANRYGFRLIPAQVVARGSFSVLEVNRGKKSGVKENMSVIIKEGLVGRVIELTDLSSKILLITDPDSSVAAASQRSRDLGVVEGYSPDTLLMRYVPSGGDIQTGDKIVTSSISSVFPAGIPLGTVTRASKKEHDLFYEIEIKPAANFSRLEEVFLVASP